MPQLNHIKLLYITSVNLHLVPLYLHVPKCESSPHMLNEIYIYNGPKIVPKLSQNSPKIDPKWSLNGP